MEMKKRILCVDDEPQNLELLTAILEAQGYDVVTACNGLEALARVADSGASLVLLDVMMSDMSGFEVSAKIREHERFRTLPVVLITALSSKEDRIRGIEAGADDFITKPFDKEEVLVRVRMLLKMRSLDEELQTSYNRMTEIADMGAEIMRQFQPALFDFDGWIDQVVRSMACFSGGESSTVEAVLTGVQSFTGFWNWRLHAAGSGLPPSRPVALDAAMSRHCLNGAAFAVAGKPGDDPRFSFIAGAIEPHGIKAANMVIHAASRFCMIAFNYAKEITRYDTMLVNYFATQCLFIQQIASQIHETDEAFTAAVKALALAAEVHDNGSGKHVDRIGEYAAVLSKKLGMADDFCEGLRLQARLHDVGKIHTPVEILQKSRKPTDKEWAIIRQHTTLGANIIGCQKRLSVGVVVATTHHEKWDGSGYPQGLKGEEIPLEGRIVAIADIYDTLRSKKVYKKAFDHETSCKIISAGDGRTAAAHFDPRVLSMFLKMKDEFAEIYERNPD